MGFLSEYKNMTKTEEELSVESFGLGGILVGELDKVAAWRMPEGSNLVQPCPSKRLHLTGQGLGPELSDEACAALQMAPDELDDQIAGLARDTAK